MTVFEVLALIVCIILVVGFVVGGVLFFSTLFQSRKNHLKNLKTVRVVSFKGNRE